MLLPAVAVLALVAVVAVAATGSTPSGSTDTRMPADVLLDTIFSLSLVLLIPAAAILVYGLMQRKAIAREVASGRYRRTGLLGFLVFALLFAGGMYWRLRDWQPAPSEDEIGEPVFPGSDYPSTPVPGSSEAPYEPEFAWLPVLVVLGLAALGVAAAFLAARRRASSLEADAVVAERLADVLDDTLDDLRAETDPRRAVIAAYARLERALSAHGFPRRRAETQQEYVARILDDLDVDRRSVRRLTDLFTRAKFSQHDVDVGMKEEAIAALEQVRDELRTAEARRAELRAEALRAREEPA
ncbi:MAG: hypothetical protein A2Y55_01390 [Actinobacteria bacterium RBG_16_68_12]|nr:MAG: hypothetical protein A2Y55_01390 [Actinobacteria bacterium RBG_16_68_12]